MAKTPFKERLLATAPVSGNGNTVTATPDMRTQTNARRLEAAHKHLDRMFAQAVDEQIDGRRFYGRIRVTIPFQDGVAQDIQPAYDGTDRA